MTATAPRRGIMLSSTVDAALNSVNRIDVGLFQVHANGLAAPPGAIPQDEWEKLGPYFATVDKGLPFAIGDWVNYGEDRYGELAAQAVDATDWSQRTIDSYRWVARQVPPQNRFCDRGLGIRHHQLVAKLPPRDQKKWLTRALGKEGEGAWTVARLNAALREGEDRPIIGFYLVVKCASEQARLKLKNRLEGEGLQCKESDKRASRRDDDEGEE